MTTTITTSLGPITPDLVLGYEVRTEATTITHDILGGDIHVTDGPDRMRTGTLMMLFSDETDALAAQAAHMLGGVFALTDTDREIGMSYVRRGAMTYRLESETLNKWILEIGFHEVPA